MIFNKVTSSIKSRFSIAFILIIAAIGIALVSPVLARPYGVGSYGICNYNSGGCTISLSTSGTVALDVNPTVNGVYTIQSDPVEVTTDNPIGYNLTLESSSASSAALESGTNTISASTGTPSSPIALNMNSWGYRVDGYDNFGAGPTLATTNASSSSASFAGLPLSGNSQTIHTSPTSAPSGETTDVWYGVAVDNSKPSGIYTQTVVYTATATP